MSNTHKILRFTRSSFFSASAIILVVSVWQSSWAQDIATVTGQGAALLNQAEIHTAATVVQSGSIGIQLLIGALLLLAGLLLHVFMLIRKSADRSVLVHTARRKRQRNEETSLNVYWLNVFIK